MRFSKTKVIDCLMEAKGNTSKAMIYYILKNGCNGFKCKKCPLGIVCDHNPTHARTYAIIVLEKVNEREKEVAEIKKNTNVK